MNYSPDEEWLHHDHSWEPNELRNEHLGPNALNIFQENTSAPRGYMIPGHLGQRLVTTNSRPRRIQGGAENEYGKYTYKTEMPFNGAVLAVIPMYQPGVGNAQIMHNPRTIVVIEDEETKTLDILDVRDYHNGHQHFGFRYRKRAALSLLKPGGYVRKGVVFQDSPAITDDGDYGFGFPAKTAYYTHPAVAEDGLVVRQGFLEQIGFTVFETRVIEWGKKTFALNRYGDDKNYLVMPEIGMPVNDDGILMAIRTLDCPELFAVERSRRATRTEIPVFDTMVYAPPGGRVIDIRVTHREIDSNTAPEHTDMQAQRYAAALRDFYTRLWDFWKAIQYKQGKDIKATPAFKSLLELAQANIYASRDKINLQYRNEQLDTYRAEIVIEYKMTPNIGGKATDFHGGWNHSAQSHCDHSLIVQ